MPAPSENTIVGSFTSNGVSQIIDLNPLSNILSVDLANITQFGSTAAATPVMTSHWELGYSNAWALRQLKTNGAATLQIPSMVTTLGISVLDTSDQTPGPLVATGTAISAANPAVVSDASTGTLTANSTVVRMINTTGMLQIAGMDFTVGAVNAGVNFALRYMNTTGFAVATNADWRIIPFDPQFYPRRRFITGITAANPCVITMSVAHDFTVGERVRIFNPDANFGMQQINGLIGEITAVTTGATNTITLGNIDSSAFTAFAFPTSAVAAAGITHPQVIPVGESGNVLTGATNNVSARRVLVESNALGGNNDVMRYIIKTY